MTLTAAEQAVFDHLVAGPGRVLASSPPGPGGVVASVRAGGGEGADPSTVRFLKTRVFPACQLHAVAFAARNVDQISTVLRTIQAPDGTWTVGPIGGGGGPGPYRSRPWVNFAAQFRTGLFAGGGEVIGVGAEHAHLVRLTFADETEVEDIVANGVVLFAAAPGVEAPVHVEILGEDGAVLAEYDEFNDFA